MGISKRLLSVWNFLAQIVEILQCILCGKIKHVARDEYSQVTLCILPMGVLPIK